jgi:hypothetical protein
MVGFEAVTTVNRRLGWRRLAMSLALAVRAICAATVWAAEEIGSNRAGFGYSCAQFTLAGIKHFGAAGRYWLFGATLCLGSAGLSPSPRLLCESPAGWRSNCRGDGLSAHPERRCWSRQCCLLWPKKRTLAGLRTSSAMWHPDATVRVYVLAAHANARMAGSGAPARAVRA